MKLFYKVGACSLASRIALEEAGIEYETESVDLKTKLTESGRNYLDINSKGYVPTLVINSGEILTEGAAILQYISDEFLRKKNHINDENFFPYHLYEWLTFIGTELHKQFSVFRNPDADEAWKVVATKTLERRMLFIENKLSENSFLMGDIFTVADCYFFTVLTWSNFIKLDLNRWPYVMGYYKRIAQRPSVQIALKAEGLSIA